MVRTVLFAFAGLVGVGTMVAMEARTPPRPVMPASEPLAPAEIGFDGSHDTLTKTDRLDASYVRNDVPLQPILPAQFVSPSESTPVSSQPAPQAANRNSHDSTSKKLAVALPKPRPKNVIRNPIKVVARNETKDAAHDRAKSIAKARTNSAATGSVNASKKIANTDRSKLVAEPCKPNPFGSLLRALNLSSGCQT
jgi:hypothetical protein